MVSEHVFSSLPGKEPCAIKVDVQHLPPTGKIIVLGLNVVDDSSSRDKDINLAKVLHNLVPRFCHIRFDCCVTRICSQIAFSIGGPSNMFGNMVDGLLASRKGEVDTSAKPFS